MLKGNSEVLTIDYRTVSTVRSRNLTSLWLVSVTLFVCCVVFYGSNAIRGTDQYWYLADVESVIEGDLPITNSYFPGTLLRGEVELGKPNYTYHNGPMIYFSAFVGERLGAYRGWIVVNLVCHFIVALAVFLGARRLTSERNGYVVALLYLLSPLAIWQTMSMLLEQYLSGVMALVVIGYFYRDRWLGRALFCFAVLLGTVSHPMFVAIGLVGGLAYALSGQALVGDSYDSRTNSETAYRRRQRLISGLLLVALIIVLYRFVSVLFPTGFFPRLSIAIANVIPDQSSMFWYFTDQGYSLSIPLLVVKAKEALFRQFFNPIYYPFNLFTNIALLAWCWLFACYRHEYGRLLVVSGFVMALYLGLIVLMQHQPRYQQQVSPVAFILIAVAAYKIAWTPQRRVYASTVVGSVIIALLAMSGYLAHVSHEKAVLEGQAHSLLRRSSDFVGTDSRVVAYDCNCDQRLNYILNPRPVLNVKSRYLGGLQQEKAFALFEPDYFISSDSALESRFSFLSPLKSYVDPVYGQLFWYEVDSQARDNPLRFSDLYSIDY